MLYFDHASTTKISSTSLDEYVKASEQFFNPSALYQQAGQSKLMIESARNFFLKKLGAPAKANLIFTGSASEANNSVIQSHVTRLDKKYIFSAGEHSSVYETAKTLKDKGFNVVFVPLLTDGRVNEELLYQQIDKDTVFVSIIHVSNETGAINDIKHITENIKAINKNVIVHSDGVQALGKVDINLTALGVDYYTISAHKINGPKGVAGLYVANPNRFKPFILGGGQEQGLRSGTENLPGIMAFKTAFENLTRIDFSEHKKAIVKNIHQDHILISSNKCVDNIISICFNGVRGETILHMLESKGYLIGTGSACNSKAGVNRVLQPLVDKSYIEGAIRISFGEEISVEDCKHLAEELDSAVAEYILRIRKK